MKQLLFTIEIFKFLIEEGFTHVEYRGIEPSDAVPGVDQEKYILRPAKENISKKFEESDIIVERIDSLDVMEMLEYTLGIDFYVEIPETLVLKFNK